MQKDSLINNYVAKNESGGLNIEGNEGISSLFDNNGNSVKSNSGDATLIINIKFIENVNMTYLKINGVSQETNPSFVKCWVNKSDIDFSDVNDIPSTDKFDLTKEINKKIKLNIPKWRNISELTFYFENEEADYLELNGIEFYGTSGGAKLNIGEAKKSEDQDYVPIKKSELPEGVFNLSKGETIESFINKHKDKNVFVDFHATWCGPCKQLGPVLIQKALQIGALVLKVDVDEHKNIAEEKGISSIPVVILYKKGVKSQTMVGFNQQKLDDLINLARN
jgi:thioredoxin 1